MGDLSNLPNELLVEIVQRLTINADYIRFHAVCDPWRTALSQKPSHRLPCQPPWLMLPPNKDVDDGRHRSFFSPSDNNVYRLELPEAAYNSCDSGSGKLCWGSSEGWLSFVDRTSPAISLLNPLTKAQIQLPPLSKFPDVVDFRISKVGIEYFYKCCHGGNFAYSLKDFANFFLEKIVLSKNPTVDNYSAMAICGDVSKLAFCRSGDDNWTAIREGRKGRRHAAYQDIIYFKGQFYAVNSKGRVVVCDISRPNSAKTRSIMPQVNLCCISDRKYLVDLSGELLLVFKHAEVYENYGNVRGLDFYRTLLFVVFKLVINDNGKEKEWVEVKSLGDSMLFLSRNSSFSLSAKDFSGCKANCIYFNDDFFPGPGHLYTASCPGGHDSGIFNLEDGSVEPYPCYIDKSMLNLQPTIWVTPSLY